MLQFRIRSIQFECTHRNFIWVNLIVSCFILNWKWGGPFELWNWFDWIPIKHDLSIIWNGSVFKDDLELLPFVSRSTSKLSLSRPGAVEEPSSNIRQSQAASILINGCQWNIKLTGILSRNVRQLREATLEHHLYSFEWIEWNKYLLTYWR